MTKFIDILEHVKGYRHVIWDWNGTLLNDTDLAVEIVCGQLTKYGLPPMSIERYKDVFGFPVKDYYEKIGFDFSKHSFTEIGDCFIENYYAKIHEIDLFHGVKDWLSAIQSSGIQQSILSAAKQAHLEQWLPHFGIAHHFENICGIDNHYAAGKIERGQQLVKLLGHPPCEAILIGDTDHDLEVGEALGVDVLLVADGHQSPERLHLIHHNVLSSRFVD